VRYIFFCAQKLRNANRKQKVDLQPSGGLNEMSVEVKTKMSYKTITRNKLQPACYRLAMCKRRANLSFLALRRNVILFYFCGHLSKEGLVAGYPV